MDSAHLTSADPESQKTWLPATQMLLFPLNNAVNDCRQIPCLYDRVTYFVTQLTMPVEDTSIRKGLSAFGSILDLQSNIWYVWSLQRYLSIYAWGQISEQAIHVRST